MMKSATLSSKIVPKIYGYIFILFGLFLQNVDALPILLKRDDRNNPIDQEENKQKLINKLIGAVTIVVGFCICFFGHQFYNKIIFFVGFACGVMLGRSILNSIFGECSDIVLIITCTIIGIIIGSLAIYAYKISLCILGALAGYGCAALLIAFVPSIADKFNPLLLTVILAIIFIILIFVCEIPLIIIATGITGSYMLFYGIDTLINTGLAKALQTMYDSQSFETFHSSFSVRAMVFASLIVAVLGQITQFITYRNKKDSY